MLNLLQAAITQTRQETETTDATPQPHTSANLSDLYHRYVRPIYRYAYSRVGNHHDAEDITEQVFIDALDALHRYEEKGRAAAWLFTIARRRIADFHRGRREHLTFDEALDTPADQPHPESQVSHREQLAHLQRLLATLDDDRLELLRLRFAADLTYGEIGQVLDKSEAAVKMAVHRLLDRLRGAWHHPAVEEENE